MNEIRLTAAATQRMLNHARRRKWGCRVHGRPVDSRRSAGQYRPRRAGTSRRGIRDVLTGQIVAFLREKNINADTLAPLLTTGSAAVTAGGSAVFGVLNLSLTTMGFAVVLKRIDGIQHRLQQTQDRLTKLDQKVDLSFFANLLAALDLANDAFTLVRTENRESAARQSVDCLAQARHYYWRSPLPRQRKRTSRDVYLATLTLASVAEARCYLELEELGRASQRLKTASAAIMPHVRGHVTTLLTSNPAAYLHPALKGRVDLGEAHEGAQLADSRSRRERGLRAATPELRSAGQGG